MGGGEGARPREAPRRPRRSGRGAVAALCRRQEGVRRRDTRGVSRWERGGATHSRYDMTWPYAPAGCFACFAPKADETTEKGAENGEKVHKKGKKSGSGSFSFSFTTFTTTGFTLGSATSKYISGLLGNERPSIRSNVSPTPRRADSAERSDGPPVPETSRRVTFLDKPSVVILSEAADTESDSDPCTPQRAKSTLRFRHSNELFINTSYLSSKNTTELESVRHAFASSKVSPSTDFSSTSEGGGASSSSGSSAGAEEDGEAVCWSPRRHKLQNGIDRELKRQYTPLGAKVRSLSHRMFSHIRVSADSLVLLSFSDVRCLSKGYLHNATARLKRRMKRLNLRLEVMRGDGNCQFRALSFQLFGSQDLYEMVRERSVSYLKEYREHYEDFLGGQEEFDHYLCQVRFDVSILSIPPNKGLGLLLTLSPAPHVCRCR